MTLPVIAVISVTCLATSLAAPVLRPAAASSNASGDPEPCLVAGTKYSHGQQVSRDDPCEFCLCLDGELFCWWQDCPVASGPCVELRGRASCGEWSLAANSSGASDDPSSAATTTPRAWTEPVATNASLEVDATSSGPTTAAGCYVMGTEYKVGETLPRETGTCLECVCDVDARVTCSPKDCVSQHDDFRSGNTLDMFDVDTF